MKKNDLTRVCVIVIGLWCCFQGIIYLMYVLFYTLLLFSEPGFNPTHFFTRDIIVTIAYIILAIVTLKRTDWVMSVIHAGESTQTDTFLEKTETVPGAQTGLQKRDVLYIVLIGVGLILLIPAISEFLDSIYAAFTSKISNSLTDRPTVTILIPLIKVLLPLVVILFAKRITNSLLGEE